jgi:hypothetical protein
MTMLQRMLESEHTNSDEIADWLDRAAPAERIEAAFALDRAGQRALFQRAGTAARIGLEHFVPRDVPDGRAVHHRGKNSLPLATKHKFFEKRFARPRDGSPRLFGYNQAPSRKLIGPGYFVALSTSANPRWSERGAVVVDYYQVPDGEVPAAWPKVIPNSRGLQWFVYHRTRDFMRRVSQHVSIGAAYKGERALDQYFVLVRQDGG